MNPPPATASAAVPPIASSAGSVSLSVHVAFGSGGTTEPEAMGPCTPKNEHPEMHTSGA